MIILLVLGWLIVIGTLIACCIGFVIWALNEHRYARQYRKAEAIWKKMKESKVPAGGKSTMWNITWTKGKQDVVTQVTASTEQSAILEGLKHGVNPKTIKWVGLAVLLLLCYGCSPVAPSFTCLTKPRLYILTDGTRQMEVDHYTSVTPCPIVPID